MVTMNLSRLSDADLISTTKRAAADERRATVQLVALLAELDARRLYLGEGCSSLFSYCTSVLHLSEHAAYHRIEAARTARRFPAVLDRLAEGSVTLTAIGLLRRHLTPENHGALLGAARHQTKRELERLVARLSPKADVASMVRRLPAVKVLSATPADRGPFAAAPAPSAESRTDPAAQPVPLAATTGVLDPTLESSSSRDRYLLRLTIGADTHAKLQRARDLLLHAIPSGDPAAIVDRALTVLVAQLERAKIAAASRSRSGPRRATSATTRHIPAAVRRAVWKRDGGRCTFVGTEGRCAETGRLEFHHVTPYARGGLTDAANLTLRCQAHNAHDARLAFGDREPRFDGAVRW
jgi:5-methylcytosine-specific restriction endonuclease McrA